MLRVLREIYFLEKSSHVEKLESYRGIKLLVSHIESHTQPAKPKKKIIQNRKTGKKFGQNRKPHTKPSKTDTMVTSGAYRAN